MRPYNVVCDRCRVKMPLGATPDDGKAIWGFLKKHDGHNFTGLRLMPADFLSPHRSKHYQWELGVVPDG